MLSASENRRQPIGIILDELDGDGVYHIDNTKVHKLVVTCPVEIKNEEIRLRNDFETSHEDADNTLV